MPNKKYEVRIYSSAQKDIQDIKKYLEQVLFTSEKNLLNQFYKEIELLEDFPEMHPFVNDDYLSSLGYRFFPVGNYLVFYIVKENIVQIHRVIYGRRDYKKLFE